MNIIIVLSPIEHHCNLERELLTNKIHDIPTNQTGFAALAQIEKDEVKKLIGDFTQKFDAKQKGKKPSKPKQTHPTTSSTITTTPTTTTTPAPINDDANSTDDDDDDDGTKPAPSKGV